MENANETDSSSSSSYMSCSFPDLHVTSSYGRNDLVQLNFNQIFMSGKNNSGVRASSSMGMREPDSFSGSSECVNEMTLKNSYAKRGVEFFTTFHKNEELIDHYGNTPLYWAVYYKNYEVVQRLVERCNFPVNWQNYSGDTALSTSIKESSLEIAKYLLEHGANPNIGNASEETPLHYAACLGEIEMCELLLKFGAYVDIEDGYGETALHWAVREEIEDAVDLLVKCGADPNHMNEDGESPLLLAKEIGREDLFIESAPNMDQLADEFDLMDIEDYVYCTDSDENSATVVPSSIDEKNMAYFSGVGNISVNISHV